MPTGPAQSSVDPVVADSAVVCLPQVFGERQIVLTEQTIEMRLRLVVGIRRNIDFRRDEAYERQRRRAGAPTQRNPHNKPDPRRANDGRSNNEKSIFKTAGENGQDKKRDRHSEYKRCEEFAPPAGFDRLQPTRLP